MKIDHFNKRSISNRQLVFIIIQISVGTGILSLPRTITEVGKQDSWISIIVAGIIWSIIMTIMVKLNSRFPDQTIIEYSQILLGKILGKLVSVLYIIYGVLATAITARIFTIILNSYNLPNTPIIATLSLLIFTCYYLSNKGLKTLARVNEFLFFVLSPLFMIMFIVLFKFKFIDFRPVFGTGISTIFASSFETIFSFIGPEIILIIFPFISHKDKALGSSLIGIAVITLTYIFVVVISIGFYGIETLQYIIWPTVSLLKAVKIPFFGRLEFVFIFFWIGIAFTTVSSLFYMSSFAITNLLKLKNQKLSGLVIIPIILFVATLPTDLIEIYNYAGFLGKFGSITAFIIPLFLLVISVLFNKKGETDDV